MKTLDLITGALMDETSHDSGFISEQLVRLQVTEEELEQYIAENSIDNDIAIKLYLLTAKWHSLEDIKQIVAKPTIRIFGERKSHLFYEV